MKKYKTLKNTNLKNIIGGKNIWNYSDGATIGSWIRKHF
ncbi:bacteriocin [Companilactobacillus kimchiensis]|nr:bacteriocin [Companilactobacillus kimchiensis]